VSKKYEEEIEILSNPEGSTKDWYSHAIETNSNLIILDLDDLTYIYDDIVRKINGLRKQRKEIILLSSDIYNALLAIDCSALHFCLKPVQQNPQKIINALQKGLDHLAEKEKLDFYKNKYEEYSGDQNENSKVDLPISNGVTIGLAIKDILRLESFGQFTNVYLRKAYQKKTRYTLNVGLGECEMLLPKKFFFRVHKKYIINKLNIKDIVKLENNNLVMNSKYGTEIPVSRRKKKAFKTWIN